MAGPFPGFPPGLCPKNSFWARKRTDGNPNLGGNILCEGTFVKQVRAADGERRGLSICRTKLPGFSHACGAVRAADMLKHELQRDAFLKPNFLPGTGLSPVFAMPTKEKGGTRDRVPPCRHPRTLNPANAVQPGSSRR